ncbi:MAG: ATP-binding protein [Desulfitobacteriaceae bacterium]
MSKIERFVELFAVPEFVIPYLSYFVSEKDIDLVLTLDGGKLSAAEVAAKLGIELKQAMELLQEAYLKNLANREEQDGELFYFAADFYDKLDYQCKFGENYHELDKSVRDALDRWCYDVYKEGMKPYLAQLKRGEKVKRAPETYELISNLEEFIDSAREIRQVPCNCRRLAGNCERPTETCLAFDDTITDRSHGREVSKEEAKEIVKMAHKNGLMHQVNSDWREKGPSWICNCCSCCCYPLRLAQEEGSKGVFPVIKYVAVRDLEQCTHCGICTRTCQFSAFHRTEEEIMVKGKTLRKVGFDLEQCYGCGLCADSCPSHAITMQQLSAKD